METRKILIATKTYPSISRKYKETVCTAGLLLDENEKPVSWIRIYPIRFRKLDFDNDILDGQLFVPELSVMKKISEVRAIA